MRSQCVATLLQHSQLGQGLEEPSPSTATTTSPSPEAMRPPTSPEVTSSGLRTPLDPESTSLGAKPEEELGS